VRLLDAVGDPVADALAALFGVVAEPLEQVRQVDVGDAEIDVEVEVVLVPPDVPERLEQRRERVLPLVLVLDAGPDVLGDRRAALLGGAVDVR
jgi:hypothetical protein